jgi:hypothetical protein
VIVPFPPESEIGFPEAEAAIVFVNRTTVVAAEAVSVTVTVARVPFATGLPLIPMARQVRALTADEHWTDFPAATEDGPGETLIDATSAGL